MGASNGRILAAVLAVASLLVLTSGCAGPKSRHYDPPGISKARVITVPGDDKTISAAVAAAHPGDLVLVSPGVYRETVRITTNGITLRGTSRAGVIIDGQILRPNGIVVTAPDVTVQNLTVRNASLNGILFTGMTDSSGGLARGSTGYRTLDPSKFPPLQGFHVDHVTSYNNGLYGIYAFDTEYGLIENSYTSGMADSGLYVGQCKPCHIVVRNNVAERNAVGYEGTNASGDMTVVGNRFVGNRVGATTDSDHQEAFLPQNGSTMVGNVVADNNQADTPEQADGGFGIGLGISGGTHNVYQGNLVVDNHRAGVVITSADDLAPRANRIVTNTFRSNRIDVAYTATAGAPGTGNCLTGNRLSTTLPHGLATTMKCPGSTRASSGPSLPAIATPPGIAFTDVPGPPALPDLVHPATASPAWSTGSVPAVAIASVAVPPATLLAGQSRIRF